MVDAETGTLLWSMTPATTPAFPGVDSIPSSVATLDSDSDSYIDRLYVGDTGGYVWRIDMPGSDASKWNAVQLATLGHDSDEAEDRRFFGEPTIARALITETFSYTTTDANGYSTTKTHQVQNPYDAVLIGSGDRTAPLDTNTQDKLFMIKDKDIISQNFTTAPTPITVSDLYDYTSNPFEGLNENSAAYKTLATAVSLKEGWFVDLEGSGEKSVAKPEAIAGVAYYSAFVPASATSNSCSLQGGEAFIYALDLALGINIYTQRKLEAPGIITDRIALITVEEPPADPNNPNNTTQPVGHEIAILNGKPLITCDADGNCDGIKFKTMRTHMVIQEQQ